MTTPDMRVYHQIDLIVKIILSVGETRMEEDLKIRNKEIRRGAFTAFLFVVFVMGVSQIVSMIVPSIPSQLVSSVCMIVGTIVILATKGKPDKGTLFQTRNKMTATGLIVLLGAFMAAKLVSLVPSALLLKAFVNEENASALESMTATASSPIYQFIFLGIVTPFGEEIVFRGCIGSNFRKHGIWFAMIMSSVLFAMYHCNMFQLVSTFLPGIVLFYIAMNYSIKWSILFHFINNGVMSIGFTELKKVIPVPFIANYGEYILEIALVILMICLLKKDKAGTKLKSFLGESKNEKGVYKAAIGNVWFILILIFVAAMSIGMLAMLDGSIQMPQP